MRRIRTRFAPSPTGGLHIGGVRTALFSYLYAQHYGGDFVLRIEDTDQTRYVEGAEQYIYDTLLWCGLPPAESPKTGGQYAPYRQSERKEVGIYQQYAQQLLAQGNAYYAFDTPEELAALRQSYEAAGKKFQYDASTRHQAGLKNSLTLPADEVAARLASGEAAVIRLRMPDDPQATICFTDLIRGEMRFAAHLSDDKVLLKADGMPTYHLAVVVDDYLMDISHAFRGEEWLPSAPTHVYLYECLGWAEKMPQFAHLPLILKPDGKGKLSKRDGDRLGFPVYALAWYNRETQQATMGFREQGFMPQAVVNFLALLGWHPEGDDEVLSLGELVQQFDISKVNKAGARFDFDKAKWFNQQHLRQLDIEQLTAAALATVPEAYQHYPHRYVRAVTELLHDRLSFANELWTVGSYFFEAPSTYDPKTIEKKWKPALGAYLSQLAEQISAANTTDAATLEALTKNTATEAELKIGDVMPLLRLALTGSMAGPGVFDMMHVLGVADTAERIQQLVAAQI